VSVKRSRNTNFIDKIWDSFASVKLAVVFFAVIALTIHHRNHYRTERGAGKEHEAPLEAFWRVFCHRCSSDVFERLGFMDMYHSWWFMAILLLFATNIVVCSIDRIPRS